MTDPRTSTAEYRSWEWELVLPYDDGSLPDAPVATNALEAVDAVRQSLLAKALQEAR